MATCLLLTLQLYSVHFSSSQWILSTSEIYSYAKLAAVGYYNDTIFLTAGRWSETSYYEFDIFNNTFTKNVPLFFPTDSHLFGDSQWWSQIDNVLYMTTYGSIHQWDLATNSYTKMRVTTADNAGWSACLAADPHESILYHLELQTLLTINGCILIWTSQNLSLM